MSCRVVLSIGEWCCRFLPSPSFTLQRPLAMICSMNASLKPARTYLKQFQQSPVLSSIARFVSYVVGAMLAWLLILSIVDESLIFSIDIADRKLYW